MKLHQTYKKRRQKRVLVTVSVVALLVFLFFITLISGSSGISWQDGSKLFNLEAQEKTFQVIISSIRFPRALAGVLVGALLGLSGAVMQGVLRNPLASPFTLGVSQAAGFGAALGIIILPELHIQNEFILRFGTAIGAFGFSIFCIVAILWISSRVGMNPTTIILAGVGLGSLFHSGTMFLQYFTDEMNAAATLFWTFGDLSKVSSYSLYFLLLVFIPSLVFFWASHWKFDTLGFGDESAFNKGVNVDRFRMYSLLFSAFCTAVAVSFFGIIGFIGLIAPHMVRLILGSTHSALLPLSALFGATLLLGADLCARTLLYPSVLPVGILTSFIGAPLLLYLLVALQRIRK